MNHVTEFAIELEGTFPWNKRQGWKLDYYKDATWIRVYFDSDRTILRENVDKIEALLKKYNLNGDFSKSWEWKDRTYNGFNFRNDDVTYALFITNSNTPYEPVTVNVSDTTDELYDIGLFNLRDAMVKEKIDVAPFNCYGRTDFGYCITFYTKKSAHEFYKQNPFKRVMDIQESMQNGKKIYYCYIYMNDKVPNPIPVVKTSTTTKRKAKQAINTINKDSKSLIQSALAKLTDEEKAVLGLLYYSEF